MGSNSVKILLTIFSLCLFPITAHAVDTQIDASITFRSVISAVKGNDMDFGIITFDAAHSGLIQLGTDGSVQFSGASGLALGGGTPTPADISVSGDGTSTIEISCEASGVLSSSSATSLALQDIEFAIDTGTASGTGTSCTGLTNTAGSVDLAANAAPKLLFGGAVNVASNAISTSDTYNTTNTGGDPVTIRIIYQ